MGWRDSFYSLEQDLSWGTSLVVQGLRICLTIQGMWVQSLVRELKSHMPWSNRAHVPQLRPDVVKGKKKDLSWLVCSSGLFTVPQHFVCPLKLCHGKSGEHPAIQSVAPADSDLGEPTCPSAHLAQQAATVSLCQLLVDLKKAWLWKREAIPGF